MVTVTDLRQPSCAARVKPPADGDPSASARQSLSEERGVDGTRLAAKSRRRSIGRTKAVPTAVLPAGPAALTAGSRWAQPPTRALALP